MTNESASKIKSFIDDKGIEYTIAIGGANEYRTSGIPRAWLVSATGEIVWEGHPNGLKKSLLEQQLKTVRLTPEFKLPKALKTAQKSLDSGQFGKGLAALQKYVDKPKDEEVAAAAKGAIKKIKRYGSAQFRAVQAYAKAGFYTDGLALATRLTKSFKGTPIGDKAKKLKKEWLADKSIKAELEAEAYISKAKEYMNAKKYKNANPLLQRVIQSKKYRETKAAEKAKRLAKNIKKYLA